MSVYDEVYGIVVEGVSVHVLLVVIIAVSTISRNARHDSQVPYQEEREHQDHLELISMPIACIPWSSISVITSLHIPNTR